MVFRCLFHLRRNQVNKKPTKLSNEQGVEFLLTIRIANDTKPLEQLTNTTIYTDQRTVKRNLIVMKKNIFYFLISLSFTNSAFSEVVAICDCNDNSGPDLVRNFHDASTGKILWSKKIKGWSDTNENWQTCRKAVINCSTKIFDKFATFCTCIDNSGPDLHLNVVDVRTGSENFSRKLKGWSDTEENWRICKSEVMNSPACQ